MVAIKSLALLSVSIASVNALSLSNALESYVQEVANVFKPLKELKQQPEIVYTFPAPPGQNEKPVPGGSPIVQCDATAPQLLDLQKVEIIPNPPQKGANFSFTAEGILAEDVEDGAYVEVDVRYGYIRLIHQTFDLCEEITKVDLECPIEKGKQVITKEVEIPNEVPPGRYIVNAKAYTKDDVFITCLSATVDFE
ncbi:Phosphatidylglycerol/phosphatidylinositol transfer protein [Cerrena zonata]|uniref:Phosphatidylglycerol/phosphatidylinositol transfer protein n=1 Tax=Cerrena zonata TaxID=2478898 RepID=A0AAW0FGG7_9APHY